MSRSIEEIREMLNRKIPRDVVRKREGGGGRMFSYLEGHYVIALLNEVFGNGGWSYSTKTLDKAHTGSIKDKYGNEVHTAHYVAMVELVVPALNCVYGDVGYGDGSDKTNPGKAHELAVKEAVTDALKRCAKNLGMATGLALYSKDQENVEENISEGPGTAREDQPRNGAGNSSGTQAQEPRGVERPDTAGGAPAQPAPVEKAGGPGSAKSRDEIDALIQSTHRVAVAKRKTTKEKSAEYLQKTFGVAVSAALTDAQAQEFLAHLNTLI